MPRLTLETLAKAFALLGLLILGAMTYISLNSAPVTLQATRGQSTILFSVDHALVLSPGSCVVASWRVDQISQVYLNGEGVVGSGQKSLCVDLQTHPTLRVVFQDGTEKTYHLDTLILLAQPAIWILLVVGVMLLIAAVCLAAMHFIRLSPRVRLVVQVGIGAVLTLAVALFIIETGLKAYYSTFGTPQEKLLYTAQQADILTVLEHQYDIVAAPYVNYVLNPDYSGINQLGYRGSEITLPKPKGVFRIVVMGDSITYGQGLTPKQAYPAQLEEILRTDYGYSNVEVVNAGVIGYTSWEALTNLSFRILDLEPDLVIFYESSNDLHARLGTADCYQGMNPRQGLDPLRQLSIPTVAMPNPSVLYRFLSINLGWNTDPLHFSFAPYDDHLCQGEGEVGDEQQLQQNPPIYFQRNLRNIIAIAQANHVKALLSTQAYYRQTDSQIMLDWWKQGVDEHNGIIQTVASEMNASSYDLMASIDQNSDYWQGDGFHPSIQGAQEYARLYAAYIVKMGWLGQPPE